MQGVWGGGRHNMSNEHLIYPRIETITIKLFLILLYDN